MEKLSVRISEAEYARLDGIAAENKTATGAAAADILSGCAGGKGAYLPGAPDGAPSKLLVLTVGEQIKSDLRVNAAVHRISMSAYCRRLLAGALK